MKLILETKEGTKRILSDDSKLIRKLKAFGRGFVKGATDKGTMTLSAGVGLWNGFKYKGNAKYGLLTAALTEATFGVIDGIQAMAEEK